MSKSYKELLGASHGGGVEYIECVEREQSISAHISQDSYDEILPSGSVVTSNKELLKAIQSGVVELAERARLISAAISQDSYDGILMQLAAKGYLPMLKWVHTILGIKPSSSSVRASLLALACNTKHNDIAQWMHSMYIFSQEEVRSNENRALRSAVAKQHYTLVRWLYNTFKLTTEDARVYNNCILHNVSIRANKQELAELRTITGLAQADALDVMKRVDKRAAENLREVFEIT